MVPDPVDKIRHCPKWQKDSNNFEMPTRGSNPGPGTYLVPEQKQPNTQQFSQTPRGAMSTERENRPWSLGPGKYTVPNMRDLRAGHKSVPGHKMLGPGKVGGASVQEDCLAPGYYHVNEATMAIGGKAAVTFCTSPRFDYGKKVCSNQPCQSNVVVQTSVTAPSDP
jgi:hypothetical protein